MEDMHAHLVELSGTRVDFALAHLSEYNDFFNSLEVNYKRHTELMSSTLRTLLDLPATGEAIWEGLRKRQAKNVETLSDFVASKRQAWVHSMLAYNAELRDRSHNIRDQYKAKLKEAYNNGKAEITTHLSSATEVTAEVITKARGAVDAALEAMRKHREDYERVISRAREDINERSEKYLVKLRTKDVAHHQRAFTTKAKELTDEHLPDLALALRKARTEAVAAEQTVLNKMKVFADNVERGNQRFADMQAKALKNLQVSYGARRRAGREGWSGG
jgi:hypothetical protein